MKNATLNFMSIGQQVNIDDKYLHDDRISPGIKLQIRYYFNFIIIFSLLPLSLYIYICVCVCVWERKREREWEKEYTLVLNVK